jgi:hypothetical protein
MATLTIYQLNAALTSDQIGRIRTEKLIPPPGGGPIPPDPVQEEIAAACAKVDTYTAGWIVPEALLTGYARDIAAWHLAKRLGKPTEEQTAAKDRALKELEDIRDGKFPGLIPAPPTTPPAPAKIQGGSRPKI